MHPIQAYGLAVMQCSMDDHRKNIRICIIGDFSDNLDEGLKNIAHYLAEGISNNPRIDVHRLNVKNLISLDVLRDIKNFNPHIIHYLPGPTNISLTILKLVKMFFNSRTKIVISTSYPQYNDIIFKILRFKPDYVFCQSLSLKRRLDSLKIPSCLLPNGVNLTKFAPVPSRAKCSLRDKYSLSKEKFTLLHVGHIKANRNLESLANLSNDIQVVILASEYLKVDRKLLEKLSSSGCKVFLGYFPHIEEFYQLSDCYIFPVDPGNSILCPLSIMEAMSCNLPVISTPFEGIKSFFGDAYGIYYMNNPRDIQNVLGEINIDSCSNRKNIESLSWDSIATEIVNVYDRLVCQEVSMQ
jgi:glycosyltransferase involved in cell wall biosynthesis